MGLGLAHLTGQMRCSHLTAIFKFSAKNITLFRCVVFLCVETDIEAACCPRYPLSAHTKNLTQTTVGVIHESPVRCSHYFMASHKQRLSLDPVRGGACSSRALLLPPFICILNHTKSLNVLLQHKHLFGQKVQHYEQSIVKNERNAIVSAGGYDF